MSSRQPLDLNGAPIDPFNTVCMTGIDAQTGMYFDADQTNSSILLKTADTAAMYIDKFQNMGINTTSPNAQLDVNSASSAHIQLTYNGSETIKANIGVSSDGKLLLAPGGSEVSIDSTSSLNVKSHNGSTLGLMLNNALVLATADQLNYNVVTPGTASNNKALVVNSSGSIAGINSLSATSLTGTLQTAYQPNLTSVDTLDITAHNGISGLKLNGTQVSATAAELNYVDTTPGMGQATKALVLDSSRNIMNIHNLTADNLTGTLQTAAQPNITSLGTLTSLAFDGPLTGLTELSINTDESGRTLVLNHESGNVMRMFYDAATSTTNYVDLLVSNAGDLKMTAAGGNVDITTHDGATMGLKLGSVLVTASADQINYLQGTTPGASTAGKALVVDSNRSISNINSLVATSLTGTIQTASQPNIASVNALDVTTHDGSNQGLKLGGVLVTATASELNYVDTTAGVAEASKAVVLDADKNVIGIGSLSADELVGELQTAAQPNVTSVGTLTSLAVAGNVTMGNTTISESEIAVLDGVVAGTVSASKAVVVDANKDISSFRNLTATNLTGTLQTAAQPNVTSVTTLNITGHDGSTEGLALDGTLITATATELNYVDTTPGAAQASKALVLDGSRNISNINDLVADQLTGTLQTAAQPNVTSVGTLTSLAVAGDVTVGSTTISEAEIKVLDGVTPGIVSASKALVVDADKNIATLNSLTANTVNATGVVATNLTGTLQTGAQPNITSVTTLDITGANGSTAGLKLGGTLLTATAEQINSIFGAGGQGTFSNLAVNNTLTLGGADGSSKGLVLGSTLVTASGDELNYLDGSTPGTVVASKAVVVDANKDISSFRNLTATNLTGTLQTAAQPNVTSVGTLTSLAVAGNVTVGSTTLSEAEVAVLDAVTPGTASASKALVIDSSKNISGINSLSSASLTSTDGSLTMGATNISESEIGVLDDVVAGSASASKALVVDSSKNISGINSLSSASLTSTAGSLTMGATNISESEIGVLDAVVAGTVTASKAVVVDANKDISSFRNLTSVNLTSSAGSLTMGATNISESEIGVLDAVVPGSASASKALVLDSSKNVSGINSVSSASFTSTAGSLTMGATNINEAEIGVLDAVTPGTISASKAVVVDGNKDVSSFRNLTAVALTSTSGSLTMGGTNINETEIGYLDQTIPGTATAFKALVPDNNKDLTGLHSLTADAVNATTLQIAGVTYDASSMNVLDGVTHGTASADKAVILDANKSIAGLGDVSSNTLTSVNGSLTMGSTNISESEIGVLDTVVPGTVLASHAVVVDANKDISSFRNLTATNLTGTLQTAAQPNVTSVGTLTSLAVAGDLSTGGNLTVGETTLSESEVAVLDTVVPGTVLASHAVVVDANKDISSFRNLTATNLTGTLQTAAQPNVTSVTTLDITAHDGETQGLSLGGTLLTTSASEINSLFDGTSDLTVVNEVVTTDLNLSGHNGSTHGLKLDGSLVTANATEMNYLDGATPGHAVASKALIFDGDVSVDGINALTAAQLTGEIQTASQPLITSVSTLNITGHDGSTAGLSLGGVLLTATATQINSIFGAGGEGTFNNLRVNDTLTLANADGSSKGLVLGTTLLTASGTELNYLDGSTPGTATAGNALVLDSSRNITNINSLTADQLTGTLQTAAQPNVTSVGTLTSLAVAGDVTVGSTTLSESEVAVLDTVVPGTVLASHAVVVDANKDIATFRNLTATNLIGTTVTGTLQTAAQPNVTSVGTLTGLNVSGDAHVAGTLTVGGTIISEGEIAAIDAAVPGTATANKAMVTDSSNSITGINSLTATNLTGTLQTAAQPNVTSVGTLTSLNVSGDAHVGGTLTVGGTIISEGEISAIDAAVPGTATANKAMVTDSNNSIGSINVLSATTLTGTLSTESQPNLKDVVTLDITGHDGATAGLKLNGTLVTSTATELNYVDTTPGSAQASKAIVLDASKNISGVNDVSMADLTATSGSFTDTTESEDTTTGAIVTAGGVGIAKNLNVGGSAVVSTDLAVVGQTSTTGTVVMGNDTQSADAFSGALTVAGGAGVAKNLNVGGNVSVVGTLSATGDFSQAGLVSITNATQSTSTTNGSIVTAGGVGIAKNLNVGGNAAVAGDAVVSGNSTLTGTVSNISTQESTSTTTGAIVTAGGVGIAKRLNVGGAAALGSSLSITGATTATGAVSIVNSTSSTNATSGALTVAGGVGVAGALNVGSTADIVSDLSVGGTANITSDLSVGGDASVAGNVSTDGTLTAAGSATVGESVTIVDGASSSTYAMAVESNYLQTKTADGFKWNTGVDSENVGTKVMELDSVLTVNVPEEITDLTDASSTTTGAFKVAGGVGIGKKLYVGSDASVAGNIAITGTLSQTGTVSVSNTTDSANVSSGSIVTAGGVGIAKALNVGTTASVAGNVSIGGSLSQTGDVYVASVTDSTNVESGAIVTNGGVGIAKALNVGTTASVAGDVSIGGNLAQTGTVAIADTLDSSSPTTGSFKTAGGAGIAKSLHVGGDVVVDGTITATGPMNQNGALTITDDTESTSTTTGAVIVAGGVGIAKRLNVGGVVNIESGAASTNTDTGALVVDGGVGIASDVNMGGDLHVAGDEYLSGDLNLYGQLYTSNVNWTPDASSPFDTDPFSLITNNDLILSINRDAGIGYLYNDSEFVVAPNLVTNSSVLYHGAISDSGASWSTLALSGSALTTFNASYSDYQIKINQIVVRPWSDVIWVAGSLHTSSSSVAVVMKGSLADGFTNLYTVGDASSSSSSIEITRAAVSSDDTNLAVIRKVSGSQADIYYANFAVSSTFAVSASGNFGSIDWLAGLGKFAASRADTSAIYTTTNVSASVWVDGTTPSNAVAHTIVFNTVLNLAIAVGTNFIWYSTNGFVWSNCTYPALASGKTFGAVVNSPTSALLAVYTQDQAYYSTDIVNWNALSMTAAFGHNTPFSHVVAYDAQHHAYALALNGASTTIQEIGPVTDASRIYRTTVSSGYMNSDAAAGYKWFVNSMSGADGTQLMRLNNTSLFVSPSINVSNTTESASVSSGSIVTAGGVGIAKSLTVGTNASVAGTFNVSGATTQAGVLSVTNNVDASSTTSGAFKVAGGVGIAKSLFVGQDATIGGALHVEGALDLTGGVALTSTVESSSPTTGSFTTAGGVGIAKSLNVGINAGVVGDLTVGGASQLTGALSLLNSTDSSSSTTGALKVVGGVGIEKKLYVGTNATIGGTISVSGTSTFSNVTTVSDLTDSSSSSTGALIVAGGAGIAKKLAVGSDASVAGNLSVSGTTSLTSDVSLLSITDSSSSTTGALTVAGGVGIAEKLYVGSDASIAGALNVSSLTSISDATDASSITTGAFKVAGGVGIAKKLYVGGGIYGTLMTASQPNVTSVTTLDITGHDNGTQGLKLGGSLITSSATELNYLDGSVQGSVVAGKAIIADTNRDVANLNALTADKFYGTIQTASQPLITSVSVLDIANHDGETQGLSLAGVLLTATASQLNSLFDGNSNLTTVNATVTNNLTLSGHNGSDAGLILGSTLVTATGTELNYVDTTPGSAQPSKALVLDSSSNITGINSLTADQLTGTIQTASQPNITSVTTLDITGHNGSSAGLSLGGTLVTSTAAELNYVDTTAGSAQPSKAIVLDSNSSISGINSITATSYTGTLQTSSQPNITSVGTLTNLSIANAGTLTMGATVVAESDIAKIVGITNGAASASKALVLDSSKNISGINHLGSTSISLGAPANADLPLEVGGVEYQYSGAYSYHLASGAIGQEEANGSNSTGSYSARFEGRVLCQEIQITSDARLKKNIQDLDLSMAKKFVDEVRPVTFNWKSDMYGDDNKVVGFIAQDLERQNIPGLITLAPAPELEGSVEEDGFVNPAGAKFTVSTDKIIVLLTATSKDLYKLNEEKDTKIASLEERIAMLENMITKLL
jgi:Chaperone of endosialidase